MDVVESEVAMFLGDFLFVALAVPGSSSLARYLPRQMVTMKQLSQLLSLQIMEWLVNCRWCCHPVVGEGLLWEELLWNSCNNKRAHLVVRHSHTQDAEKLTYPKSEQNEVHNFGDFFCLNRLFEALWSMKQIEILLELINRLWVCLWHQQVVSCLCWICALAFGSCCRDHHGRAKCSN